MLCALCETFFLAGPVARHTRNEASRYHPSIEALNTAANAGCAFCVKVQAARSLDRDGSILYGYDPELDKLEARVNEAKASGMQIEATFLNRLRPKDTDFSFPSTPTWWVDTVGESNHPKCIAIAGSPITTSASLRPILITFNRRAVQHSHTSYDPDELDNTAGGGIVPLERPNNLDSSWSQIQKWLKQCQHEHPKCQGGGDRLGWLPSRLISITGSVEGDPFVQLRDSSGIAPGAVYTTLSHCWGPDPAAVGITTTVENIDQMRTSIPWKRLSKTFQDAMKITLKLGIQYLWIDSLCIIQGSKDDWEKEVGQMQNVYSNSFLNIAATGAPDGRVGCFFDRIPVFSKSTGITLSWDAGDEPSTYFPLVFLNHSELRNTFNQEPLNNRAWVMQERTLSPRMLNFTRHQMVWECNSEFIFEALPKPSREHRPAPEIKMMSLVKASESVNRNIGTAVDEYNEELYKFWWKIVELYAETSLTKRSDKLVAISGVATRLSTLLDDNYCWGLWEKTLWHDLLWICMDKSDRLVRYDPSVAPSWSWASRSGIKIRPNIKYRVSYWDSKQIRREYFVDVMKVSRYSIGDEFNPSGPGGELRLKAFLFRIPVVQVGDSYYGVFEDEVWATGCGLTLDYTWDKVQDYKFIPLRVFCLPIYIKEQTSSKYVEGLLVEEVDPEKQHFRRIGYVHLSDAVPTEDYERPLYEFSGFSRVRRICLAYGRERKSEYQWDDAEYSTYSVPKDSQPERHFLYGCPQYNITLI